MTDYELRLEALDRAIKSANLPANADEILARAEKYYAFLKKGTAQ